MALLGDTREAIALVIVPMVLLNLWQIHRSGDVLATWRRFRPLALTMCVGIAAVAVLAASVPTDWVTLTLGLSITLFAVNGLVRGVPSLPARLDRPAQVVAGAVAGVMGGLSGVWAPPIVIYLSAIGLDKDAFVRASGLLLLLGSLVLAMGYASNGLLNARQATTGLALVVPALAGFALGERLRSRLAGEGFRRAVLLFFLVMGLNLIRRVALGD